MHKTCLNVKKTPKSKDKQQTFFSVSEIQFHFSAGGSIVFWHEVKVGTSKAVSFFISAYTCESCEPDKVREILKEMLQHTITLVAMFDCPKKNLF